MWPEDILSKTERRYYYKQIIIPLRQPTHIFQNIFTNIQIFQEFIFVSNTFLLGPIAKKT